MSKPKVLVTGSLGFIGHHLVRELLKKGYWVVGMDNMSSGLEKYATEPQEFYKMSVGRIQASHLRDIKYVFHLAARPRVPLSIEDPEGTHNHNVTFALILFNMARRCGVEKIIYSSSSSVYGNQNTLPLVETMAPSPESPYAVQKLAAEQYAEVWRKIYGLPTVSLRYFNVYGEEQPADNPYTGVLTRFLDHRQRGLYLSIYGDGEQTRDFTYVGDVVRANILAAESSVQGVFNIGAGSNHSINEVAGWIGGEVRYLEGRVGEARHTLADITKAKKELNWEPLMNLKTWLTSIQKV